MLENFTTQKYDDKIAVIDGGKKYSFADLKTLIFNEISNIKDKKENVVILSGNNFHFIIQFFASIFCNKKIYLITDKTRLKDLEFDFDVLDCNFDSNCKEYDFPKIDIKKDNIIFYTSGSSGKPKEIKKSLYNLICEAQDIGKEFGFKDKDYNVISTTTMCHLFGLTFHLMMPICNGLVINTSEIAYPENVDIENSVLVATPAFLNSVLKFNLSFKKCPKYIISAGSKLDNKVFEYLEKKSNIIEIYGSTETGVIAHKTHFNSDFKLFENVKINANDENTEVISDYLYEKRISINDKVEVFDGYLKIKNRTDRLFKIYEKRVCADELEEKLKENELIKDCYITKIDDKLVCLCALSSFGQEYILKDDVVKLIKLLKQYMLKFSEIIPQRWKFIDEIPMTKFGKINKKFIEHIFNVNLSLPIILNRKMEENIVIFEIFFNSQCNFFKGHFPKFQLVPGVVQLYLAKELANMYFDLQLGEGQWKRIKFSNIIEPKSIVNLKLEKTDANVVYEIYSDTKKYASGVFLCKNVFEGLYK